ncbi:Extracellular matrix-binding ebh, putative [Babesia ovata]|uniref:Extracellular matrix-binding ebh, putative n=1 Tax=Babesia ovata TaxID=189622 RepID=A0A2H6KDV2_9APIC|nr:Extracellular matrix-binding ebh, putative [Babesia ovata]GBE61173.1 Extracellular matrix-binding ebh, putative [Babesia ovata]
MLSQTADLVHNQVAYLVHYQEANLAPILRCNLLAALSSPFSVCRLAWIEAADAAVKVAKEKAEDVHRRLDHSDKNNTTIDQGVKQINEAKGKVSQVDGQLKSIHTDLGNWKDAAHSVLGTAVMKAGEVHKALDPNTGTAQLKQQIDKIDISNLAIKKANEDLKTQVESLHSWIGTAEDIRSKAEQKAKEAYDKLDVHAELSRNIQKIVDANERIKNVNNSLNGLHGNLEMWNKQASKVLDGAIKNAEHVHDALKEDNSKPESIGQNVKNIETAKGQIEQANKALATEVANLGNWRDAAKEVITKADGKCEEILKKVIPSGGIYELAQTLQSKGTTLFNAATAAKQEVGKKVGEALEAVVKMDGDLKRDLKQVKDEIKGGIRRVIRDLEVETLDDLVKNDLTVLRERIKGLNQQVAGSTSGSGLVSGQLKMIEDAKTQLNQNHVTKVTSAASDLDTKFGTHIQRPLNGKVQAVYKAIGTLGGTFKDTGDLKTFDKIFEHIKKQVGEIKGSERDQKGLDGIVAKVKALAQAFVNSRGNGFKARVEGWLEGVIGNGKGPRETGYKAGLAAVNSWLEPYQKAANGGGHGEQALKDQVINNIKSALGGPIGAAQGKIGAVKEGIKENLTAIVSACEEFVSKLDEKITKTEIERFAPAIAGQIQSWASRQGLQNFNRDANLTTAVKYILVALCASVRQVGIELKSLGIDKFGEILDEIKPTVDDLDKQLKEATNNSNSKGQNESPAHAVDSKLEAVRNMVEKDKLITTFKSEVKKDLQAAVGGLPNAVEEFDKQAQDQIKAAAKTAITAAAEQISNGSTIELGGAEKLMDNFHQAHNRIKADLESQVKKEVDTHIGADDSTGGQGGTITELAGGSFTEYSGHVNQESVKSFDTSKPDELKGKLPSAITAVKSDGLKTLGIIGPQYSGADKITDGTFKTPFQEIEKELQAIAWFVDNNNKWPDGQQKPQPEDPLGIKQHLKKLQDALDKNGLDGAAEKGLEAIKTAIGRLQSGEFTTQPAAIDQAVEQIKAELDMLTITLKNGNKSGTNGVIDNLTTLKDNGLEDGGKWTAEGQTAMGLSKIRNELKTHNNLLLPETGNIDKAVNEIRWQLRVLGFKLQDDRGHDDIIDSLEWLKKKIGQGKPRDGNLQYIYNQIAWLQNWGFPTQSTTIHQANSAIKRELTTLQKELLGAKDNDVITTLQDLQSKGLSDNWHKPPTKKGLAKIESELKRQQLELTKQPGDIGGGVRKITGELDDLRNNYLQKEDSDVSKKGVINNLGDVITAIDKDAKNSNGSLNRIKKDIEELNRDTVPKVNEHLGELCAKITSEAGSVDWQLKLFETENIDKALEKIKSDIHALRTGDLHKTIDMCDKFLEKADDIERNTVRELEKFVDYEVEDAIAELTKEARRDYVESARDALKHFALKAESELGELPGEINRDLFVGFKGFMRQMEGERSENINRLRNVQSRMLRALSSAFQNFFAPLHEYLRKEIERVKKERDDEKNPSLPKSEEPYAAEWDAVHSDVNALLNYLCVTQGFDDRLRGLLHNLTDALTQLRPQGFQKPSTPTLDSVSRGLSAFAGEFGGAYISTYSGAECREADADKYAKVFLTVLPTLHDALTQLRQQCKTGGRWRDMKINSNSKLGTFQRCGPVASSPLTRTASSATALTATATTCISCFSRKSPAPMTTNTSGNVSQHNMTVTS